MPAPQMYQIGIFEVLSLSQSLTITVTHEGTVCLGANFACKLLMLGVYHAESKYARTFCRFIVNPSKSLATEWIKQSGRRTIYLAEGLKCLSKA